MMLFCFFGTTTAATAACSCDFDGIIHNVGSELDRIQFNRFRVWPRTIQLMKVGVGQRLQDLWWNLLRDVNRYWKAMVQSFCLPQSGQRTRMGTGSHEKKSECEDHH